MIACSVDLLSMTFYLYFIELFSFNACSKNNYNLKINSCQIIIFSRPRVISKYNSINGEILYRTRGPIKDLDIIFDLKLKFDCQITNIVNKLNNILVFILKNFTDINDKLRFLSFKCSILPLGVVP